MNKKINVIEEHEGRKTVFINDVKVKSRRHLDWKEIENFLKEYIGRYYQIIETNEIVYIGSDFPDEFCNSEDRIKSKGANLKAKANSVTVIRDLVEIATNKMVYPDYGEKHGKRAKKGWYRYDTRFGLPVYNEQGEIIRYNIFSARILIRCDQDGKLYLYDIIRIKKETCSPPR